VISHCEIRGKQLITACNATAHHILWGSTDINTRGGSLEQYLVSFNLDNLKQGSTPTFVINDRKEVTELKLGTNVMIGCHEPDKPTLSDHRYILFQIGNVKVEKVTFHDPRRNDWEYYKDHIKVKLEAGHTM
jgi:hypothetical protein